VNETAFADLEALASNLRKTARKRTLIFGFNGTGKTRLSMAFRNAGMPLSERGDTLYFNAYTEDLFTWENDPDGDGHHRLRFRSSSRFLSGLKEPEMERRIRALLHRYADFDFAIDAERGCICFSRKVKTGVADLIKISRGEENLFIWCCFLAAATGALDGDEAFAWVNYLYIDDPVSSLDENSVIAVAVHLAQLLKAQRSEIKTIISTHHSLFYNVLCNEGGKSSRYYLERKGDRYFLRDTEDTPFFHHAASLAELVRVEKSGRLYTYHFNMLRSVLEKTANFHGFRQFSACLKRDEDDREGVLHARLINILNHGNYSLYESREMLEDNKRHFRKILNDFLSRYPFNPELFTHSNGEAP
jgi:hypothetical protein